jgi:hypothetical protein
MQMQTRSWDWTPTPGQNRVMSIILRLPLINRILSREILLLTFTGRKSRKTFTTPVGYHRDGDKLTLLTKRFRPWWRNFQTPAPVKALIAGKWISGQAQALLDESITVPIIAALMEAHEREAQIYGVKRDPNGKPDMADVRMLAPKVVVIQIALKG